jgi:type I restriction enzyme S subunit
MIYKKIKLKDVCSIKTGKKDVNEGNSNGKYPFFTCSKKHTFSDVFSFDCEAILVAGNGAVGQTTYFNGKFEAYQRTYVLTNFKDILPRLLLLILNENLMKYLSTIVLGNTIPYIKKDMLENFEFILPPYAEQKNILAKLDLIFNEIDKAQIAQKKKLKEIENFLGYFVDKKLEKLKTMFPIIPLAELVESVEYGTSKKCSNNGKYPVLRMGNIKNGNFVLDDLVYLDDKNEAVKYAVRKQDVFFNRTNSPLHVGKAALFEEELEEAVFAGYLIRINPKKDMLDPKFLTYYLNAPSIREYGYSVMTSSVNQANINGTKLKQYPFIKVDIQTQSSLAEQFTNIEKILNQSKNLNQKILNNYNSFKSAILKQELKSDAA